MMVEEQLKLAIVKLHVCWCSYGCQIMISKSEEGVDVVVSRRSGWVHFVPTIRHPPSAVVNDVPIPQSLSS